MIHLPFKTIYLSTNVAPFALMQNTVDRYMLQSLSDTPTRKIHDLPTNVTPFALMQNTVDRYMLQSLSDTPTL